MISLCLHETGMAQSPLAVSKRVGSRDRNHEMLFAFFLYPTHEEYCYLPPGCLFHTRRLDLVIARNELTAAFGGGLSLYISTFLFPMTSLKYSPVNMQVRFVCLSILPVRKHLPVIFHMGKALCSSVFYLWCINSYPLPG